MKIVKKEVEIAMQYVVEPAVDTIYEASPYNSRVRTHKDVKFYRCERSNKGDFSVIYTDAQCNSYYVTVDGKTCIPTENSDYFFDYDTAVRVHAERRMKLLKSSIDAYERKAVLIEKDKKELKELEERFSHDKN